MLQEIVCTQRPLAIRNHTQGQQTLTDQQKTTPGKIDKTGWWVLFATVSASSMAFIGGSALNVAYDAIQTDLGASGGEMLWIFNAFALFLAALLLPGGSLGDHYGRKRIYMIGIVIFTGASIASGFAPDAEILIGARIIQGIGGALMVPGSLAIVSAYFDNNTRGKAIGIWSSVTTLTSILGPILGGILADYGLWRVIFFINVPLALSALYALWNHVPESYDEEASPHLDYIGVVLIVAGMIGITYGSITLGEVGIAGLQRVDLIASLVIGVLLIIGFVVWEGRTSEPMMPLRLFKSSTFLGANLLTLFLYAALGGALYFLPINLLQIQGYSETFAGLAMIPFMVLLVILSVFMGNFVDRYGAKIPLVAGPFIAGLGFVGMGIPGITDGPGDYWLTYFPAAVVFGIGMGITVAPLTTAVMGSVPQHSAGVASGVNNAMSRASQVLALSILGGLSLFLFISTMPPAIEALEIPVEAETQIIDRAASLGGIQIPDSLSDDDAEAVRRVIQTEFVAMFRVIMWIGAGLCWMSSLLAFIFVENELRDIEKSSPG